MNIWLMQQTKRVSNLFVHTPSWVLFLLMEDNINSCERFPAL